MKYISRLTALLLAMMMIVSSAGAVEISLTQGQLDALYQAVSEEQYRYCDAGVLGDWIELDAFQNVADKKYYTFQWYDQDGNMLDAADDPCKLRVYNMMAEQQFYCIATDAAGNQLKSDIFVIPAAQTTDMEAYLSYLYGEAFYDADGNRDLLLTYTQVMNTWNVTLEDGSNLGENVVAAWWAERSLDIFDPELFCSCVISSAESDACVLHPYAQHIGTCGWYTETTVLRDEATGITVTGDIPEGVTLQVSAAQINEDALLVMANPDDFASVTGVYGYDITPVDADNQPWQPATPVLVTMPNVYDPTAEDPLIQVFHLLTAADEVADESDYEKLTSAEPTVTLNGDGSVAFLAEGFSEYFIVAGTQSDNSGNDTYYILPGVTVELTNVSGSYTLTCPNEKTPEECGISVKHENNTLTFYATSSATLGTYVIQTGNRTATIHVTTVDVIMQESGDTNVYLTCIQDSTNIPSEPMAGGSYSWRYFHNDWWGDLTTSGSSWGAQYSTSPNDILDFDAIMSSDALEQNMQGQNVVGVIDNGWGEDTYPCVKLTDEQWHKLLVHLVENQSEGFLGYAISISNGQGGTTKLTTAMVNEKLNDGTYRYKMYPYVVKFINEGGNSADGWHIDCAIVDRLTYSVSYEYNILSSVVLQESQDLMKPDAAFYTPNTTGVAVGDMKLGSNSLNSGATTVTVYDTLSQSTYEYKFAGWNTKPDGSGTTYAPGATLSEITANVTLYAQWEYELTSGVLKLQKIEVFEDANDSRKDDGLIYRFAITFEGGGADATYPYALVNSSGVSTSTGIFANSSYVELKHGEYVTIYNAPNGMVTIAEDTPEDAVFVTMWGSATTLPNNQATAIIQKGVQTDVICTNTYSPHTSTLTIKKEGMSNGESAIVKVKANEQEYMIVFNSDNPQAVIANLPIGSDYKVEEITSWSWLYTAGAPVYTTASQKIVADASQNLVTITNTRKNDKWLHDESAVENDFSDGSQDSLNNQ